MNYINFISEKQVENLVASGEYFGKFYEVDIPNQFFTKDTESGKYILHSDTAEFQEFIKRITKTIGYYYDINIYTAKVVWKLTEGEDGEKYIEFTIEE